MIDTVGDVLVLILAYACAVFGAGWLIGRLLPAPGESPPRRTAVGRVPVPMLIGWLERFLILTFILMGEATAIGFIVIAKTIMRFGETRGDRDFAEYVLCGTLASFSLALAVAVLTRWLVRMI